MAQSNNGLDFKSNPYPDYADHYLAAFAIFTYLYKIKYL